jgi:hypothetical protein
MNSGWAAIWTLGSSQAQEKIVSGGDLYQQIFQEGSFLTDIFLPASALLWRGWSVKPQQP